MIVMAITLYFFMGLWFRTVNRKKAAGDYDHRVANMSREEIEELGEDNPEYRYTY